jgi:hypothetical protein
MDGSSSTIGSLFRWHSRKSPSPMAGAQGAAQDAVPRRAIPHPLLTADRYPLYMHYRPVERLE